MEVSRCGSQDCDLSTEVVESAHFKVASGTFFLWNLKKLDLHFCCHFFSSTIPKSPKAPKVWGRGSFSKKKTTGPFGPWNFKIPHQALLSLESFEQMIDEMNQLLGTEGQCWKCLFSCAHSIYIYINIRTQMFDLLVEVIHLEFNQLVQPYWFIEFIDRNRFIIFLLALMTWCWGLLTTLSRALHWSFLCTRSWEVSASSKKIFRAR